MDGNDIRFQVNNNNDKIRKLMDKFDFTLNNELNELLKENEKLRMNCNHTFKDGVCVWCDEIEVSNG